eukprot:1229504-Pleurochrysis_carterae.AAC.1
MSLVFSETRVLYRSAKSSGHLGQRQITSARIHHREMFGVKQCMRCEEARIDRMQTERARMLRLGKEERHRYTRVMARARDEASSRQRARQPRVQVDERARGGQRCTQWCSLTIPWSCSLKRSSSIDQRQRSCWPQYSLSLAREALVVGVSSSLFCLTRVNRTEH